MELLIKLNKTWRKLVGKPKTTKIDFAPIVNIAIEKFAEIVDGGSKRQARQLQMKIEIGSIAGYIMPGESV